MPASRHAVVICTRNRPGDLRRTLASVAAQEALPLVVVVDASDGATTAQNAEHVAAAASNGGRHLTYPGAPSSARQRNYGVDHLPASVQVVHFIDDDVTVRSGYFARLFAALTADSGAPAGVGGIILEEGGRAMPAWWHLLMLRPIRRGRISAAGFATTAQTPEAATRSKAGTLLKTDWLNGCSSYQRDVFQRHRFDERLEGYALFEDLDLSYRVGRAEAGGLAVEPRARLVHHRSPSERYDAARFMEAATRHRYWFIRKNRPHPASRAAFWWSVAGRALLLSLSSKDEARQARTGLLRGARAAWKGEALPARR